MNSYKWAEPLFWDSAHICIIQEFWDMSIKRA